MKPAALALTCTCLAAPAAAQPADREEMMEAIAEAMFLASMCEEFAVDEETAYVLIDEAGMDRERTRKRIDLEFTELLSEADEDMEAASCETARSLYGDGGSDWPGLVVSAE